jgi:REP element-mobilizing transposase RayT
MARRSGARIALLTAQRDQRVQQMVIASHVIFGMYGFWLPNDPRGSWSDFVGAWALFRYGGIATKTSERRSVAGRQHDVRIRLGAKRSLIRPAVQLRGVQARSVGRGFAEYAHNSKLMILACAILPDHVHLVLLRHRLNVEQLVIKLKSAATTQLLNEGLHPFANIASGDEPPPKCFARGQWKVFLNSESDILRAIRYVESNPLKEGLPAQRWAFVTPYG